MEPVVLDQIPDGLLELPPHRLGEILRGPTLIRCEGERNPPLFLATLLHGDEPTGFLAIQELLKRYLVRGASLPRGLMLFLGNIEAAEKNLRRLPEQPDFNRIWNGGNLPEHRMAQAVLKVLETHGLFAGVDIHNSTGKNPHYACVNRLEPKHINLGRQFSSLLVYFTRPREVLSRALSRLGPSVTLEAGQPGDPSGVSHVLDYLDQCLNLSEISNVLPNPHEPRVYHSIARIEVPAGSRLGCGENRAAECDFSFVPHLESMNFREIPENELLGWRYNPSLRLSVIDENGQDVAEDFICYRDGEIRMKRVVVPSLLTINSEAVKQDCLGYLMQRYALG